MVTVAQWFPQAAQAHQAVLDLLTSGVSRQQIGVVFGPEPAARPGAPDEVRHELLGAVGGATTVALPGMGAAMAAGLLAEALGGAAAGPGAPTVPAAMRALGLPAEEADACVARLGAGGALVLVRAEEARETVVRGVFRHSADPGLSNPPERQGPEAGAEETHDQPESPGSAVGGLTGGMVPGGWGEAGADIADVEDGRDERERGR